MPFCSNCGNEIKPGAAFCGNCGQKQTAGLPVCANCGKTLEEHEKFCPSCGTPFQPEPPKPKPEESKFTKEGKKIISGGAIKQNPPVNPRPPTTSSQPKKKKRGCLGCFITTIIILIILVAGAIVVINYATNWFDIIKEEWNKTTQVEQPATERVVENPENKLNQPKQNAPAKIVSTKNNDIAAAAKNLEEIFEKSDVNALQALLTETSLPEYKSILTNIQPYMPEYAKAFKSRKLVHSTPVFAQYAFSDEKGNKFTVEFALTGNGMWKLVRF